MEKAALYISAVALRHRFGFSLSKLVHFRACEVYGVPDDHWIVQKPALAAVGLRGTPDLQRYNVDGSYASFPDIHPARTSIAHPHLPAWWVAKLLFDAFGAIACSR